MVCHPVCRFAGYHTAGAAPTWAVAPYALPDPNGQTQIAMEATIAYDDSGVSYGFWNVTNDPAGNNIVWQPGLQFIDVNLVPATTYCYRVKARDGSVNQNATAWSVQACATTPPPGDRTAPMPPGSVGPGCGCEWLQWQTSKLEIPIGSGVITMPR